MAQAKHVVIWGTLSKTAAGHADGKCVAALCCHKGQDDSMHAPEQQPAMQANHADGCMSRPASAKLQHEQKVPVDLHASPEVPHDKPKTARVPLSATEHHDVAVDCAMDAASSLPAQLPRLRSSDSGENRLSANLAPDTFFKPKQGSFKRSKSREWSFTSRKSCNV